MPTSGYVFTNQEITVRFRAPYISESLNQQFRGIVPAGVYEGFNPQVSGTPLHIDLATDPSGRSSAVSVSDLNTTTSVSVHLTGVVDLDLSAYASQTVAVCIDLSYAFPADTTGTINVYDLGTEAIPATSCVLAKVVVPAAGLIPAANISLDDRSFPFLARGRDATPLVSVVRNGAPYLTHDLVGLPDFWDSASLTAMTYIASNAVLAPSGFNLTFRARKNAAGLGNVSGILSQKIGLPIPTNRRLRLTVAFRPTVVPSVGNPVLSATITDAAGVTITTVTLQLDSAVVGVWETYSTIVQLPDVTTTAAVVKEVFVQCSAVSYTTVGVNAPIFDIADVDLQLEQHGPATDAIPEISGESHHTKVRLYEDAFPGAEYADLTYGSGETVLSSSVPGAGHTFRVEGNEIVEQDLTVIGSTNIGIVFASSLDAPAPVNSGPIAIGPVNATEVTLGRATKNVRVVDTLLVNTVLNPFSAKVSIDGGLYQTGGRISLDAGVSPLYMQTSSGDVTIEAATTGYVEVITDTGPITIQSASGRADMLGAAGVVLWSGTALPPVFTGDTMIGSELGVGGVSIFAGGQPPNAPMNALLISALTTVNIGSAILPAAVVEAIDIDIAASTGDALLRSASGGIVVATGTPPAPTAGNVIIQADSAGTMLVRATGTGTAAFSSNSGTVTIGSTSGQIGVFTIGGNLSMGTFLGGVSIFAGGAVPVPAANTLLLGAADDIDVTTAGASGLVRMGGSAVGSGVVIFTGGALPAGSPGDMLLGNALGSGGVSIFAGGTPPAPATNELQMGSASNFFLTSGNQFTVTAATSVTLTSGGGNPITLQSVGTLNLNADGPVNIATGVPGGVISLDGIIRTRKAAGGVAFDIDGAVTHITTTTNIVDPGSTAFPTISLLRGIYNIKAMVFVDPTGTSSLDLTIAASTGNIQGFLVNSLLEDSATHNEKLVYFSGAMSQTFVYNIGTSANAARVLDGTIEFLSDCTVTCTLTIAGNDVSLKRGSFFRFFMIRAT